METAKQMLGAPVFSVPGVEIHMDMGHVYVNGEEVDREEMEKQIIKLAAYVMNSGEYSYKKKHYRDTTQICVYQPDGYRE